MLYLAVIVALLGLVAAKFDPDLHTKYKTMPKSSFVEYFNKQNYSWTMADHLHVENTNICAHLDSKSLDTLPTVTHNLEEIELPENFDARQKWFYCDTINDIYNQGACGSCWTFGTATTASDRTCIHKGKHVRLSEQDFECLQEHVCRGGNPISAFKFWETDGLVTEDCKPYNIKKLLENKCQKTCITPNIKFMPDKHFARKVYRVSNDSNQIKSELVKNGPIQAAFSVYEDFKHYDGGIYEYKYGDVSGGHSVRIIGYGVEDGVDYWLVANSWGTGWGENGWFKIKSYQEEINFEGYLVTGMPYN